MKDGPRKNRWLIAASAVGTHLSIGSVYAFSAWQMPLQNTFGWSPTATSLAFSVSIFFMGLSAAFLGRLVNVKGPRYCGLLSAVLFGVGLVGSGLACQWESVPLFYLFFGVVAGIASGVGYISPVATLVKWFPDRRGLATGIAIMGFGLGGLVCANLIDAFVPATSEAVLPIDVSAYEAREAPPTGMPEVADFQSQRAAYNTAHREGTTDSGEFKSLQAALRVDENGKLGLKSVVYYDKSTIVMGFVYLGLIYFAVMVPSALYIAPPPEGYEEEFDAAGKKVQRPLRELSTPEALRTPAFYGLWFMFFLNVACGIAVIATAKNMGYEMVHLSVGAASVLVMGISLFNGLGRLGWAALSDTLGRSNTYVAFFAIQVAAFPALASLTGSPWAFMAVTFVILSCYGGGFACLPAYITDLFGLKSLPTLYGIVLTAKSVAGVVGPMLNAYVYERTNDYRMSLYLFGGLFAVALCLSLFMRAEVRRIERQAAVEAADT